MFRTPIPLLGLALGALGALVLATDAEAAAAPRPTPAFAPPAAQLIPAQAVIVSPYGPPPPRYEPVPPPPRYSLVWDPGHWSWDGRQWIWVAGHYEERPHPRAVWVIGRWERRHRGQWVWVPAHWQ